MHTTVNFLFFANNFSIPEMYEAIATLGNDDHFRGKFHGARGNNGTEKFYNFMMELTTGNKERVIHWIEDNYNASYEDNEEILIPERK
jgi:hypothetical protein